MKRCSKCKKNKPKSNFRAVNYGDGSWDYEAWCKDCHKEYVKQHPRKYDLDKVRGKGANKYRANKFNEQGGCCAICGKEEKSLKKKMALDHNHETGKWRGLLCNGCNLKLGWTEKRLDKILIYLEKYK